MRISRIALSLFLLGASLALAPALRAQSASDLKHLKKVTIDVFEMQVPAEWRVKPQGAGVSCENRDQDKVINATALSLGDQESTDINDVISRYGDNEQSLNESNSKLHLKKIADSYDIVGDVQKYSTDYYDATNNYRIITLILMSDRKVMYVVFYDFNCKDLNASTRYFTKLIGSCRMRAS